MSGNAPRPDQRRRRRGVLLTAACLSLACVSAAAGEIERQREAFMRHLPAAERGDWSEVGADEALLRGYVLWPDLRAAYLRANLGNTQEIERFLARYGNARPARTLRYHYARQLAKSGRWQAYLEIYETHYANLGEIDLDCLALRARAAGGSDVTRASKRIWMHGRSRPDECDPLFAALRAAAALTEQDYDERAALAIEAREFRLARYLARSGSEMSRNRVDAWLRMHENPERELQALRGKSRDEALRLVYGVRRLALRDAPRALALWRTASRAAGVTDAERIGVARHIALAAAQDHEPIARALLRELPAAARDERTLAWRARLAVLDQDWDELQRAIALMPAETAHSDRWRFWRAEALFATDQRAAGERLLEEVAAERSYYGFLAADIAGLPYRFDHAMTEADDETIARLASEPEAIRARELYLTGLHSGGRAQWAAFTARLSKNEKRAAAVLAHRWGWHSRAIAIVGELEQYDDLDLRYPLPFNEWFADSAGQAAIPAAWAYGVARSESLFMADVRSSAGAIGVMQLMPATGRITAGKHGLPFAGVPTLTDPQQNIALGTRYLAELGARFGNHRALATAAYNAGPHRVERWLPTSTPMRAATWIETLPYDETRAYVQRVLAAEAIFHWRLTGEVRRLSAVLTPVPAKDRTGPVVSSL